jgi:hypothetical protein
MLCYAVGMQALDDIRESTRAAAIGFTKALAQQIMRACSLETAGSSSSSSASSSSIRDSSSALALGAGVSGVAAAAAPSPIDVRDRKRKRKDGVLATLEATTAVLIPILLDKGLVAGACIVARSHVRFQFYTMMLCVMPSHDDMHFFLIPQGVKREGAFRWACWFKS